MTPAFAAGVGTFVLMAAALCWLGWALLGRGSDGKPSSARMLSLVLFLPAKLTLTLGAVYLFIGVYEMPPLEFVTGAVVGLGFFALAEVGWWGARRYLSR